MSSSPNPGFGSGLSADGRQAVFGAYGDKEVFVIDPVSGRIVRKIAGAGESFGLTTAFSGSKILIGAPGRMFDSLGGAFLWAAE
jgi:hypothetical protein